MFDCSKLHGRIVANTYVFVDGNVDVRVYGLWRQTKQVKF